MEETKSDYAKETIVERAKETLSEIHKEDSPSDSEINIDIEIA